MAYSKHNLLVMNSNETTKEQLAFLVKYMSKYNN